MFASLAEEFGFVGCIAILLLYAAVIFMSLRIASIAHSHFGRLGAAGVTATLTFCVLMNGAMVMGLAPVVGVPMPLLSWGGTVMMSMMLGFALIMAVRVQRYAEISECYLIAGPADYVLRVVYRDSADFERIHTKVLTQLPGVMLVQSALTLRTVKRTTALPI